VVGLVAAHRAAVRRAYPRALGQGLTMSKRELLARISQLEAENVELRARAGELPAMPCNKDGLPFSGPRLVTARCLRGLSLDEFAEQLRVSRQDLIGFESETVAPTMEQIGFMSILLHFPLKWFFARGARLINSERISWRDGPWTWNADNLHWRKWLED